MAIICGNIIGESGNIITIISGLTGIVSVVLCAQGKISFYVFGYIQLLTYVFGIAIPCALWGEVIENIFYFVTMMYGMYIWFKNYGKTSKGSSKIKAKKLNKQGWFICLIGLLIGTFLFSIFLKNANAWFPVIFPEIDSQPMLDSFTTIAPAVAQILLMLGYREQWAFWIIENIASIIMFIIFGNWIMVAQYLFWTINCIYGWFMWSKNSKINTNI